MTLSMLGCAQHERDAPAAEEAAAQRAPGGMTTTTGDATPQPRLIQFTNLYPTGSCDGRWTLSGGLSSGNGEYTLYLSGQDAHALSISAREQTATYECILNIVPIVPSGTEFALTSVSYDGDVFLEAGVTGERYATYGFSSQRTTVTKISDRWTGPEDGNYNFEAEFPARGRIWSGCGATPTVQIRHGLTLRNAKEPGRGTLRISMLEASVPTEIVVTLVARACSGTITTTNGGSSTTGGGSVTRGPSITRR